jgi:dihydroflavonol-4-reductase
MILVTGGSGLLGQELIEQLLQKGEKVIALYNKTPLKDFNNSNVIQRQADILDVIALDEAMQGITKIYHCAAIVSFLPKDKEKLFKTNIEGTANVVNAALSNGVKKIVHVSSVAALGRIRKDAIIDETMEWTPETSNSVYGESKYRGEMEVWRGVAEGLEAAIVNPSIILGAANWDTGSTAIFKNVYKEFPWYTTGTTGWVDVKDVAAIMLHLMESTITAERYIVSGENETYQNVFNHIADAFGKKRAHKKVTPFLAAVVWRLEKWKSWVTKKNPLITEETAKTALADVQYNNTKVLNALKEFQFTPLTQTIKRICHTLISTKQ